MKAAVLFEPKQPFEVREVAIDRPEAHEVLVRVAASGLCHSDWHFANGDLPIPKPAVLGHEVAGVVEATGADVRGVRPGDHVVTSTLAFCGQCNPCVSGRTHACTDKPKRDPVGSSRLTLDGAPIFQGGGVGGYAEHVLVHEKAVVKVDRAMPLDRAALLGCGVLTGLGSVFNAARVSPGSKVVIIGAGGVGLNVIQGARIAGAAQIVAVDLNSEKEKLARHFGATDFVLGGPRAVEEVREVTNGGVDFAFEVIGLPETITQGVEMMVPAGLMTIVGATRFDAKIPLPGLGMMLNEWRVQGTFFGGSPFTRDIPRFASMYLAGRIDLDTLISGRIALGDINQGFNDMLGGKQARRVITFDDVLAHATANA